MSEAALQLLAVDRPRACRFAARLLGGASAAEDMVQEAMLKVLPALRDSDRRIEPARFFYRTLTNVCLSELRKRKVRGEALPASDLLANEESSETLATTTERRYLVLAALSRIPERQRVAIVLKQWEDLSYAAIADAMEITETHAATLVWRGLKNLRQELERGAIR